MKEYSTFIFEKYSFIPEKGIIELHYSLDDELKFVETLEIPTSIEYYDDQELDRALFLLHILGGISYFKTCLPKKIEIRSGALNEEQAKFFTTVYEEGLGEFFFQNKIDYKNLIKFPCLGEPVEPLHGAPFDPSSGSGQAQLRVTPQKLLVPIGGGKDSIVTIELLKKKNPNITLFRLGSHPLIDIAAQIADEPLLSVKRKLSPELFKLNAEGALNGHVPITAYLSTVSLITAITHGFDTIAISNERSSSEGNVEYLGKEINHQWSKSFEFEQMYQEYIRKFVSPSITYFSLLRPLSELRITQIMTQYPQYYGCFTSCNKNWKILSEHQTQRWCGDCPKCAFAFAMFSAFLDKKALTDIFGMNMFDEENLLPLFEELLGLKRWKPFECVGTVEETQAAFQLAHERGDLDDTLAMKLFLKECSIKDPKKLIEETLSHEGHPHAIPKDFLSLL